MDEEQHRQVRIAEVLDQLYELSEPLAGVLDPDDAEDAEVLDHFERVIEALEDRQQGKDQ